MTISNKLGATWDLTLILNNIRDFKFWKILKFRYVIFGTWNTIFGLIILYIFNLIFESKLSSIWIFVISSTLNILNSFIVHRFFIWKSKGNIAIQIKKFLILALSTFFVNFILIKIIVVNLNQPLFVTQLIITFSFFIIPYRRN